MATFSELIIIERAKQWLEKGKHKDNPFDRVTSLQIAFNIRYSLYSKRVNPDEDPTQDDAGKAN